MKPPRPQAPRRSGRTVVRRRDFLTSAGAFGAGVLILPKLRLFGANAPSNKLNIAMIGVWGRAMAHYKSIENENVVALCDVNERHLDEAAAKFAGAKKYVDWRQCLQQKDIQAVMCCTADHTHAFIANWAMNRGFHVYCEKPLATTVYDTRTHSRPRQCRLWCLGSVSARRLREGRNQSPDRRRPHGGAYNFSK
jgi:hypothetical protein